MATSDPCAPGDLVQLDPEHYADHAQGYWAGRVAIVDKVTSFGAILYAQSRYGRAYRRAEAGTYVRVGRLASRADLRTAGMVPGEVGRRMRESAERAAGLSAFTSEELQAELDRRDVQRLEPLVDLVPRLPEDLVEEVPDAG